MVSFLVINLSGAHQSNTLDSRCKELESSGLVVVVKVVTMRAFSAAELLDRIEQDPSFRCMLPWMPLMDGGDREAIIERWRTLAEQEPDSRLRSDYAALAIDRAT